MDAGQSRKFDSVQALRGLAAFMVLIFHSKIMIWPREDRDMLWWWPGLSDYGDLGVSLFFVISGFIIAHSLSSNRFVAKTFVWHRFMRIYPLYWFITLFGLFQYWRANWFHSDMDELGIWGIVKSFLIFPQKLFPFIEPGWSLEHEVIFYLIAVLIAPRFGIWALALVMAGLAMIGDIHTFTWDYHLFADPQIYFCAGLVAYQLRNTKLRISGSIAIILLSVSYAMYYHWIVMSFPSPGIFFAFGAGALIVTGVNLEKYWRVPRPFVALGDASYSLYLWHWLVLAYIGGWRSRIGGTPEEWRWIFVIVSIGSALISYRLIERPLIALSHLGAKRLNVPSTGLSADSAVG